MFYIAIPEISWSQKDGWLNIITFKNNISTLIDGYESLLRGIASYLLGITAFVLYKSVNLEKVNNLFFYAIYIIQFSCLFFFDNFANFLFIMLLPFTLLGLVKERNMVRNFFSLKLTHFLGEISFSLYLIHFLFVMNICPMLQAFISKTNLLFQKYIVMLLILSSVLILSTILYYYFEKPLNKILRNKLMIKTFAEKSRTA